MKQELLLLKQVRLQCPDGIQVQFFSLCLYEKDFYSIVCDNLETRTALADFFRGKAAVSCRMIRFRGKQERQENLMQIFRKKGTVIGQKGKLISALSIAENICLFSNISKWNYKKTFLKESEKLGEMFHICVDFQKSVDELTDMERVCIELLKAYAEKRELIVLDGLSMYLSQNELSEVHQILKSMQSKSDKISFIMLENLCDTVFEWSDRCQIIKAGTDFGVFKSNTLNRRKLYDFYLGHSIHRHSEYHGDFDEVDSLLPAFELHDIFTDYLSDISFCVSHGELLNVFCADLSSLIGICRCISGRDKPIHGEIYVNGEAVYIRNLRGMRKKRICYFKTHAYDTMLIPDMTVHENIMLELAKKMPSPYIQKKYQDSIDQLIEQVFGKGFSELKVCELAVLDRQKLAFFKIYLEAPAIVLCERPFLDSDIQLMEVTKDALKQLSDRGIAIIILTMDFSSLNEFEGDSVYIKAGRLVDEDEIYQTLYPI
ncbi:MAG: hypothetical protein LUE24_13000 [Lachnospiraceae bacterium]|nr:hypothetical protein [Lachnospiraceae bacterium]